jgi:hypothetical protein
VSAVIVNAQSASPLFAGPGMPSHPAAVSQTYRRRLSVTLNERITVHLPPITAHAWHSQPPNEESHASHSGFSKQAGRSIRHSSR